MAHVDAGDGTPRQNDETDYSAAFEAGIRRLKERARKLAREREELPLQLERLLRLPRVEQEALLTSDPTVASWTLAEQLIEECLRMTHSQARQAAELAELAIRVSAELGAAEHGPGLVEDLRARAWAAGGEVRRLRSDLGGAEDAFAEAGAWIARGSGDALEEARLMELEAALHRDQQHIAEAHRLLDSAAAIYRRCRDFHLVGRAHIEKGRVFAAAHEIAGGIQWVRKGLGLLDSQREPQVTLSAQHSLMLYLYDSGRVHEAWFMLQATRADFAPSAGELLSLRLTWLEGNLQRALGMLAESEASLAHAHEGFIAQGLGFEAALAGVDLMALLAEQGRVGEIPPVAERIPTLRSRDLPSGAAAALAVMLRAEQDEAGAAERVRELGEYLRQARKDHKLRFDEPA